MVAHAERKSERIENEILIGYLKSKAIAAVVQRDGLMREDLNQHLLAGFTMLFRNQF